MKKVQKISAIIGIIAILLTASLKVGIVYAKSSMANTSYPFTWLNEIDLGGKNQKEAQNLIASTIESHLTSKQKVQLGEKVVMLTPYELGLESPLKNLLSQLKIVNNETGDLTFLQNLLTDHHLEITADVDIKVLEATLKAHFPEVFISPQNSTYTREGKTTVITDQINGQTIKLEPIAEHLRVGMASLQNSDIALELDMIEPNLNKEDLETFKDEFELALSKRINFMRELYKIPVTFSQRPEWFTVDKEKNRLAINKDSFLEWFNEELRANFETEKQDASISMDENGKVTFEGVAKRGVTIDDEKMIDELASVLVSDKDSFQLPVTIEEPKLTVTDNLKELGITELIGVGYTDFRGSTQTRIHNIRVGLSKFNGNIVAPEETFSFVDNLGYVDGSTGYKKELVIKQNETKKEYGGGLCQVSSTAFRAALFTGLPIVERSPHSYAVSYYARPGGQGLDATIYPGVKDLKFKNDTPAHILLQTHAEGTLAFFNVYGTSDDRKVEVGNYRTWNWKSAPPEVVVQTTEIAPGQKKVTEQPLKGFEAAWDRIITKGGQEEKETIQSRYTPWAKRTLVGIEKPAEDNSNILNFPVDSGPI